MLPVAEPEEAEVKIALLPDPFVVAVAAAARHGPQLRRQELETKERVDGPPPARQLDRPFLALTARGGMVSASTCPPSARSAGLDSVTSDESGEDSEAGGPQSGTGFAGEATTTVPSSRGQSASESTLDTERFVPRGVARPRRVGRGDPCARSRHPARSGHQDSRSRVLRGHPGDRPIRRRGPDHGPARAPQHRSGLRVRRRLPRAALSLHEAHRRAHARRGALPTRRLAARSRPPRASCSRSS